MTKTKTEEKNKISLIDSHCHLPSLKNKTKTDALLLRAKKQGVVKFINIGTSIKENNKALETSAAYQNVYPTAAIYPHENRETPLKELKAYLTTFVDAHKQELVAIGEAGMDITNGKSSRSIEDQLQLFRFQAALAKDAGLPLVVHTRNADAYTYEVLSHVGVQGGVIHCFSSDWEFAKKVLDLGFYISFSGMITYKSRKKLHEVVKKVPKDKFLIETDSPYLPPQGHRGEKNEPGYVRIVAQMVADLKRLPFNEIASCSTRNAESLFNI